ncbi:MAG TPA: cation transporter [Bacteroidales bacterium]|nr:cation transporter [Bacteroidales bacterium]
MKNIFYFVVLLIFVIACGKTSKGDPVEITETVRTEITISGMSCTGCEETISSGALALDGVRKATASHVDGKAWVTYDTNLVTLEQITASIEKKGYDVTGVMPLPDVDSVSN